MDGAARVRFEKPVVMWVDNFFLEDIPVPGTDLTLHYAGNRVPGHRTVIHVPASGESIPESLKKIL